MRSAPRRPVGRQSLSRASGHRVEQVSLGLPDDFLPAFLNVVNSGLDYENIDWDRTEPHIRANRQAAMAIDSLTYVRSVHQLQRATQRMSSHWGSQFDLLVTPTMGIEPPRAGEVLAAVHEGAGTGAPALQVFQMAVFTSGFNMSGQPAISLPVHTAADGTPIGVQLVAGPWEEVLLLRVALSWKERCPWAERRPSL